MSHSIYKQKRNEFFERYPEYWADLYGQEYSVFDVMKVDSSIIEKTKVFAEKCGRIFFKVYELLTSEQVNDETLLGLGFPKETLNYLRIRTTKAKTVIGRFDSIMVNGDHKLMEFNSDTPTFIYELYKMNGELCKEFGLEDPNKELQEKLARAVKNGIFESYSKLGTKHFPNVVFTSHSDNIEDKNTVKYLKEICGLPSEYIPLNELRIIKGEALLDKNQNKIDVLYRQTFPVENIILDTESSTGEKIGVQLLDLVQKNKLAVVNPPSAFLLQNKAIMAVIWGLHEEGSVFFTEEEHSWIEKYFLPTYMGPEKFLENKEMYVKKPVFGREGDTVVIHDPLKRIVIEDKNKSYTDYMSVYQKYIELPKKTFQTEEGEKEGHFMVGTFLINGEAGAFGIRVGNKITDNLSYFLPVGVKEVNG